MNICEAAENVGWLPNLDSTNLLCLQHHALILREASGFWQIRQLSVPFPHISIVNYEIQSSKTLIYIYLHHPVVIPDRTPGVAPHASVAVVARTLLEMLVASCRQMGHDIHTYTYMYT